jgi:hypothetical protein
VQKNAFIIILNKMLSNKMKIKAFIYRQQLSSKRILFEMLNDNIAEINRKKQEI